ncbi:MAG: hypothetical protein IBX60_09310 [Candidatus Aminicenantes bacterium]|nr:hypothetical protein [Candidatus Aminicenantes bacterium]
MRSIFFILFSESRQAPLSRYSGSEQNFRFSLGDRRRITKWAADHLMVAWRQLPAAEADKVEELLIRSIKPLLNLKHNPSKLKIVEDLRRECREIAQRK